MRLQNYLNEDEKDHLGIIEKECKPFLSYIRMFRPVPFVYRGVKETKPLIYKVPRQNRRPLDTDPMIHNIIDNLFYDKFGWKPRSSGVFTYTYSGAGYGENYYFFPTGRDWKYLWSPDVQDLFITLKNMIGINLDKYQRILKIKNGGRNELDIKRDSEKELEIINTKLKDIVNTYKETDYTKAFNTKQREIVWKCSSYYLLNVKDFPLT